MKTSDFPIPRHWWGKLILGVLGLLKGGMTGAVIGVITGHFIDRFIGGLADQGRVNDVFLDTLFAVLGHVCKADGRVTEVEIAAVEQFMGQLGLQGDKRRAAIRRFNEGKAPDWDLEAGMHDFVQVTHANPQVRQMFLEYLLNGAAVDGTITQAEQDVLYRVARALRIPTMAFVAMVNAYRATHSSSGSYQGPQATASTLDQAYATLGVEPSASDADIKRAYRRLVARYHPDRLASSGMPEKMIEQSKNRAREINVAYDAIKASRGIK
ncbi:co-chaperone DjlA [Marinihelvus fidelis]|uniref:Co-chaperone DjlA n=1 Tax=Marinihelvus fidelis TaxID=2613842 RepID=A0A5N0TBW4_9GAMM|nr:co-chaperone DjlA [Marinihelvus fidelis]KAA9130829.1 co-chaperone DjlA [Marinihelvus fidelis]